MKKHGRDSQPAADQAGAKKQRLAAEASAEDLITVSCGDARGRYSSSKDQVLVDSAQQQGSWVSRADFVNSLGGRGSHDYWKAIKVLGEDGSSRGQLGKYLKSRPAQQKQKQEQEQKHKQDTQQKQPRGQKQGDDEYEFPSDEAKEPAEAAQPAAKAAAAQQGSGGSKRKSAAGRRSSGKEAAAAAADEVQEEAPAAAAAAGSGGSSGRGRRSAAAKAADAEPSAAAAAAEAADVPEAAGAAQDSTAKAATAAAGGDVPSAAAAADADPGQDAVAATTAAAAEEAAGLSQQKKKPAGRARRQKLSTAATWDGLEGGTGAEAAEPEGGDGDSEQGRAAGSGDQQEQQQQPELDAAMRDVFRAVQPEDEENLESLIHGPDVGGDAAAAAAAVQGGAGGHDQFAAGLPQYAWPASGAEQEPAAAAVEQQQQDEVAAGAEDEAAAAAPAAPAAAPPSRADITFAELRGQLPPGAAQAGLDQLWGMAQQVYGPAVSAASIRVAPMLRLYAVQDIQADWRESFRTGEASQGQQRLQRLCVLQQLLGDMGEGVLQQQEREQLAAGIGGLLAELTAMQAARGSGGRGLGGWLARLGG